MDPYVFDAAWETHRDRLRALEAAWVEDWPDRPGKALGDCRG
jgi:hypothetical protein